MNIRQDMNAKTIYTALLATLLLTACSSDNEPSTGEVQIGEPVTFSAKLRATEEAQSRAEKLVYFPDAGIDVTIVAPGYGSDAEKQQATYSISKEGAVTVKLKPEEKVLKWSAQEMNFSAWSEPDGVSIANGTVDFTNPSVESLIGATAIQTYAAGEAGKIRFNFSHLVSKLTLKVKNNEDDTYRQANISFSAIRKTGYITTSLNEIARVHPGSSGETLASSIPEGGGTLYFPPLSKENLNLYGAFSIKLADSGAEYVGTLKNANLPEGIKAGEHVTLTLMIKNDGTAEVLAVTIARWNENKDEYYNRPEGKGVWGAADFKMLARLINGEVIKGVTLDDYYEDKTAASKIIRLYTDIDLSKQTDIPSVNLSDIEFDGNGYTISNFNLTDKTKAAGLFGTVTNATIRNLRLEGCSVEGTDNIGSLVGETKETVLIDNCRISGNKVVGSDHIGGLAGAISSHTTIRNCCVILKTVSGQSQIGGLVGTNQGTVINCFAVIASGVGFTGANGGGLIGSNQGNITNCYTSADFTNGNSESHSGALIGDNANGATANNCYWNKSCIDNTKCLRVIGSNTLIDGKETLPNDLGKAFSIETGLLAEGRNDSNLLRDALNDYLDGLPVNGGNVYKRWALISTDVLPTLRP